ncbi:TatD family hydrolase [Endozoicomonas sp. Mp262]|uniref:TatD family hydrolase n=1 Tax=Endozoicomonas sp. Mp262 TaxID=2919499 RepID=UPI0021D8B338
MSNHLVDIGVNLTDKSFDSDRDQVIERARQAGIKNLIITGTSIEESENAATIAVKHHGCFSTAGIHPHHAKEAGSQSYHNLHNLLTRPKVVAVGETGLDFNRDFSPRPVQEAVFEKHIELALNLGKPLFCHERDASQRFIDIIKPYRDDLADVVIHCFTADRTALYQYLDLDFHIGITGWICDERRGTHLHDLISDIPPNRLMVETDAPYLLPRTLSPKPKNRRNEPCFLPEVVSVIAEHTKRTFRQVAEQTTATAMNFFNLDPSE